MKSHSNGRHTLPYLCHLTIILITPGVDSAFNRNIPGVKGGRQGRKADNLTAIYEPIV
jgi:hypothetical protein